MGGERDVTPFEALVVVGLEGLKDSEKFAQEADGVVLPLEPLLLQDGVPTDGLDGGFGPLAGVGSEGTQRPCKQPAATFESIVQRRKGLASGALLFMTTPRQIFQTVRAWCLLCLILTLNYLTR